MAQDADDAPLPDDGSWRPNLLERIFPPLSLVASVTAFVCAGGLVLNGFVTERDLLAEYPILQLFAERRGLMLALAGAILALAGMVPWRWPFAPCPYAPAAAFTACINARARTVSMIGLSAILYILAFIAAYFPVRAFLA